MRELYAVVESVETLLPFIKNKCVRLYTDNTGV